MVPLIVQEINKFCLPNYTAAIFSSAHCISYTLYSKHWLMMYLCAMQIFYAMVVGFVGGIIRH